jgi:hypothetical protein
MTESLDRPVHIAASPYKTATSSIGKALIAIGVGSRDMGYRPRLLQKNRMLFREMNDEVEGVANLGAWIAASSAMVRDRLAPLAKAIQPFDVFSDAPYGHTHIHPAIRKALTPGARFIWVNRPFEDWIDSVRHWEIAHPDTYQNHGLWETDPAAKIRRLRRLWDRHYIQFRHVADAFPDDCLEIEMSDIKTYDRLCAFYGVPVPREAFPEINVSRSRPKDGGAA